MNDFSFLNPWLGCHSKLAFCESLFQKANCCCSSDMDEQRAQYAECIQQLHIADPPSRHFQSDGLQALDADSPIDKTQPTLSKVRETVARLRGGKVAGV